MKPDYLAIEDDQNRRNAAALQAADIGVFEFEPKTSRAFWDDRVRQLWGATPGQEIDYDFVISQVHPEDQAAHNQATQNALDPNGSGEMDMEYRLIARDDQPETWIRARAQTLFENGAAVRLVGTVEDITIRKTAQLRNDVLLRELQHRLKNTLAVVGAVLKGSKSSHVSLNAYADAAIGRIHAMSQAQDLLRSNNWQDVWLSQICESVIESLVGTPHQITTNWDNDILIPEQYVLTSSMAIYELVTNSLKYGALGAAGGHVSVSGTAVGSSVRFEWKERGAPDVEEREFEMSGFGTVLLCSIWPSELNGTSTYRSDAQGAVYELIMQ